MHVYVVSAVPGVGSARAQEVQVCMYVYLLSNDCSKHGFVPTVITINILVFSEDLKLSASMDLFDLWWLLIRFWLLMIG